MGNKRPWIILGLISLALICIVKYAVVITKHPFFCEKIDEFVVTDLGTIGLYKVRNAYSQEGVGLHFGSAKPNKIQDFFYIDFFLTRNNISVHGNTIIIERICDKNHIRYEPSQSPLLVSFVCQ